MSELQRYTISFAYADNEQLFDVDALLTEDELNRVKTFFGKLLAEGYIRAADKTDPDEIEYIVYETPVRVPVSFADIKVGIERGTTLREYAQGLQINL